MQDRALAGIDALVADEGATFMAAALVVNDCVDDAFDRAGTERELARLSDRYDDRLTPWSFLREEGFGGHSPVDVVQGSRIDAMLESRSGLPITLAALVAHVAERSGQSAHGINFPAIFWCGSGRLWLIPIRW